MPAFITRWLRSPVPPEPRPASLGCSVQLEGRPSIEATKRRFERGQAPAASICVSGATAGAFAVALRAECQRARRIRAQQLTRMRVNARKSSYGMKQSIDRSINLQERKNNSWHPSAETNEFEPMPLAESNTISMGLVPVPPNEVKTILPSSLRRPISRGLAQFASVETAKGMTVLQAIKLNIYTLRTLRRDESAGISRLYAPPTAPRATHRRRRLPHRRNLDGR